MIMNLMEIIKIIRQKWADALLLSSNRRYANSFYLCGYCVELSLKYAVSKKLNWNSYITTGKFNFLKTHDLELLVALTGEEKRLKNMPHWSVVNRWHEQKRYEDPTKFSQEEAKSMLLSTRVLVEELCKISL